MATFCPNQIRLGSTTTTAAAFAKWLKENPRGLVAVTADDGVVGRLAEEYTP